MLIKVNNRDPRLDVDGNIIDAHDGALEFFEGRFYWYGTAYGDTDWFTNRNEFHVYTSPDLSRWPGASQTIMIAADLIRAGLVVLIPILIPFGIAWLITAVIAWFAILFARLHPANLYPFAVG
jgi:hypothetical protein